MPLLNYSQLPFICLYFSSLFVCFLSTYFVFLSTHIPLFPVLLLSHSFILYPPISTGYRLFRELTPEFPETYGSRIDHNYNTLLKYFHLSFVCLYFIYYLFSINLLCFFCPHTFLYFLFYFLHIYLFLYSFNPLAPEFYI